jgi:hypothetical protein
MENQPPSVLDENWATVLSLLPPNWCDMAHDQGAIRRLRGIPDEETLLRLLLLHVARGYSLRETVAIARQAKLASISDVALLNRLRSSEGWLWALCKSLFMEISNHHAARPPTTVQFKSVDGCIVREPGKTGSQWMLHYALRMPSLECAEFTLLPSKGDEARGESFKNFSVEKGDCLIGDRAYANAPGIHHVASRGGNVLVRVNTGSLILHTKGEKRFPLLRKVGQLKEAGEMGEWNAWVPNPDKRKRARVGRVIAVRKTEAAADAAIKKLRRDACRKNYQLREETLEFAKYVIIFTDLTSGQLEAKDVLSWYRMRWQIELLFKRFKSLADTGHLPKHSDGSARAWLYGKLLVCLLAEKLVRNARDFSPWGCRLAV